jgi:hypothetical protein
VDYETYPRPNADMTKPTKSSPPSGTSGSQQSTEGAMGKSTKTGNGEGSDSAAGGPQ